MHRKDDNPKESFEHGMSRRFPLPLTGEFEIEEVVYCMRYRQVPRNGRITRNMSFHFAS